MPFLYLYCGFASMMFGSEKLAAHFCAAKRPPSAFLSWDLIVWQSALKGFLLGSISVLCILKLLQWKPLSTPQCGAYNPHACTEVGIQTPCPAHPPYPTAHRQSQWGERGGRSGWKRMQVGISYYGSHSDPEGGITASKYISPSNTFYSSRACRRLHQICTI